MEGGERCTNVESRNSKFEIQNSNVESRNSKFGIQNSKLSDEELRAPTSECAEVGCFIARDEVCRDKAKALRYKGYDNTGVLPAVKFRMYGIILSLAQVICFFHLVVVLRRNEFAERVARHVVKTVSTRPAPSHYLYYARHHGFQ